MSNSNSESSESEAEMSEQPESEQSVSGQSEDGSSDSEPDVPAQNPSGGVGTKRKFYCEQAMECDGPSKGTYLHNPLHNVLSSIEYMPCLLASIA